MIDMLKLGFKDIIRYFKSMIILVLSILIIAIIFVSCTSTNMFEQENESCYYNSTYQTIITGNDLSKDEKWIKSYQDFVQKNGCTYFWLDDEKYYDAGIDAYVVIGNAKLLFDEYQKSNQNQVYSLNMDDDKVIIKDKEYHINKVKATKLNINYYVGDEDDRIPTLLIVLGKDEAITDWCNYQDYNIMSTIINYTIFEKPAITYEKQLDELFSLGNLSFRSNSSNFDDKAIVLHYLYPYLLLFTISIMIAFYMFYNYFLKKMYREYLIHILYGARKRDIVLRNSVLQVVILIITLGIYAYLARYDVNSLVIKLGFGLIILIVALFEIIMILKISSNKQLDGIKGAYK